MSLIIKNPRVYAFYEKHPNFDFEKMNELLVDLLENFQESVNPSLNTNFAAKLYEQMETMQVNLKTQFTQQQLSINVSPLLLLECENGAMKEAGLMTAAQIKIF